jgi:hypothetical protein
MAAKYILGGLAALFIALAFARIARSRGGMHPQARAWLLIGVIFGVASGWLFYVS